MALVDALFYAAVVSGVGVAGIDAFVRPDGAYRRAALGLCLVVLGALSLWAVTSPFMTSDAAGNAFALFCAVTVVGLMAAAAACAAATLRHTLGAVSLALG
jgi:hypothetical protein